MKLTKDEARILAEALKIAIYELNADFKERTNNTDLKLFSALENLEKRLSKFGADKRRTGRTSVDWFSDCIKRFVNAYNKRIS